MQPWHSPPGSSSHFIPEPPLRQRFLANLREHSFALVLVITLLAAGTVFAAFSQLERASDYRAQAEAQQQARTALLPLFRPDSTGFITLASYPSDADIFLDGAFMGQTPMQYHPLKPGIYTLLVQKDAHQPVDSTIEVKEGQFMSLTFPLVPASGDGSRRLPQVAATPSGVRTRGRVVRTLPPAPPPPQPVYTGRLTLLSEPEGAAVWIDERLAGQTPLVVSALPPGQYEATFRKDGYKAATTIVSLGAGQKRTVQSTLPLLTGTLRVLVKPWGSIYVNGALVQESTNVRFTTELPPGPSRITVVHPVLGTWETVTTIRVGREASFVVDFNKETKAERSSNEG